MSACASSHKHMAHIWVLRRCPVPYTMCLLFLGCSQTNGQHGAQRGIRGEPGHPCAAGGVHTASQVPAHISAQAHKSI
eukprot:scaffold50833_cov20-Tisochrysis_lutea.AAC.4